MQITRRQFIGWAAALGLTACARMRDTGRKLGVGTGGSLTFATVNDLHVLDARSTAIVNRAMDQITANAEIAFVVFLGDLSTSGQMAELSLAHTSFERLKVPYHVVPGNHDVFMRSRDILGNFRRVFGEPQWRFDEEGWAFLGLNSCDQDKSDVWIQPENMRWLKDRLDKIGKERPIALFCHHPLNPSTKEYRVANADEVLGLFAEHKLKLVASGHYHGNQEESQNGILFTTTACCSSTRPNFDNTEAKGYRLFHITGAGDVTTEFVEVKA